MILVLFSWCYIAFTLLNWGILWQELVGWQKKTLFSTCIHGLFAVTLFTSSWCFFSNTGVVFYGVVFAVTLLTFFLKFSIFKTQLQNCKQSLAGKSVNQQRYLLLFVVILALISSKTSLLIDNETYYIQTIKWLNEYGYVKGIANLHLFLGQTSGWHSVQSAFNFSFATKNLNDLSGFIVALGLLGSFTENAPRALAQPLYNAFPWVALLLLPFIAAPSPDVAVVVLSYFLFVSFISSYASPSRTDIQLQTVLVLLIVFCKATAFPVLVIPLFSYAKNRCLTHKDIVFLLVSACSFLLVFIAKNYYITGYPLFPFQAHTLLPSHAVPQPIMDFYFSGERLYRFAFSATEWRTFSFTEKIIRLFIPNTIYGFLNGIMIVLCFLFPIMVRKNAASRPLLLIYGLFLLQLLVLVFTSFQWRFALHYITFMGVFIYIRLCGTKLQSYLQGVPLFLLSLSVFFAFSSSGLHVSKQSPHNNLLFPAPVSSLKPNEYQLHHIGNLRYHSPPQSAFYWQTGNGPLPCVNQKQVHFNQRRLGYIPQYLNKTPKNGFYSKPVQP